MAVSVLMIFLMVAVAFAPASAQTTCPACDCQVNSAPVLDQLITTKINNVLGDEPSKLLVYKM